MPHRWNQAADVRRRQIETGVDLTFCNVFLPYYSNLIRQRTASSLLEIGCGTGHLSLNLSRLTQNSVALEPSPGMYDVAKEVLSRSGVRLLNCTVQQYSEKFHFDLVLSHMCLQVADSLGEFLSSVVCHMSSTSSFIFSIPHPCFYNEYKSFFPNKEFNYMSAMSKEISFAVTKEPEIVITGVPYHHRPLSSYFSELKSSGFYITDFHEIFPPADVQELYGSPWRYPRYCVLHAKLSQ